MKRIQFLRKRIERVRNLYNKYYEGKRTGFYERIEDISHDDTKELWNLLQIVRELACDINEDYRSIVSDGY